MATIQGIYIALFGRPADPLGLAFFNEATNNGADLTAIGDLAATAEYQSRFEGMNNAQIVTAIYQSLFGRNPELAGLEFFVAQLESGAQNINTIAINILDGAQGADAEIVANKEAAAEAWTAAVAADPDALAAYQGQAGIDAGVAYLAGITDDESTIPTEAELEADLAALIAGEPPAGTPGDTFTLTDAIGETVTGTNNDDTFVAVLDAGTPGAGGAGTFNTADQVNGMGGTDTLNISVITGGALMPPGASVKNVEIVNINQSAAAATGVKSSSFEGVEELWQISTGANNFQNVVVAADVTAGFRSGDKQAVTAGDFVQAASGTQTELSVALAGVGSGSTLTFQQAAGATEVIETINISGSVASPVPGPGVLNLDEDSLAGTGGDATTLNLNLTADADVRANAAGTDMIGVETLDASGSTGNLTMDVTTWVSLETINGGSGGDAFTVDPDALTEDVTINMGAGNDVLTITSGVAAVGNDTTTIMLGAGNDTLDVDAIANIAVASAGSFRDGLIVVTDFNASDDVLDVLGISATLADNTLQGNISAAADLHAALNVAAAAGGNLVFEYGDNLYVFDSNAATFSAGDGLIEIQGIGRADLDAGVNFIA